MEAELFDELWRVEQDHWWFVGRRRVVASLVERFISRSPGSNETMRVCELGCGTGGNLVHWDAKGDVCGMDVSEKALKYARQRVDGRVEQGSLPDNVPFDSDSFDLVLMTDVLEHIEDDESSARVALSLLKEGGVFVATVPAHQWLFSPRDTHHQHFRRYAKDQFAELFAIPGAEIEFLSFYNSLLFAPAALARMAAKIFESKSATGDLKVPFGPLNRLLAWIFSSESRLLGRIPLPTGLSLVAVVRRTGTISAPLARKGGANVAA